MGSVGRGKQHEVAADAARLTLSGNRRTFSAQHAHSVAFVCGPEILCLTSFSLIPALLPQFIVSWSLSNAEAGWLAGIMSAGYMAAALPLVTPTDRIPGRTIFLAGSVLNALSCFGIVFSDGLLLALIWRAVSGIGVFRDSSDGRSYCLIQECSRTG
jgi:MFS family permease